MPGKEMASVTRPRRWRASNTATPSAWANRLVSSDRLSSASHEFTDESGGGPGVRLSKRIPQEAKQVGYLSSPLADGVHRILPHAARSAGTPLRNEPNSTKTRATSAGPSGLARAAGSPSGETPPPWTVIEHVGSFWVQDASGQSVG
jgi:hypothetical protein